jgi:hypothetical protein
MSMPLPNGAITRTKAKEIEEQAQSVVSKAFQGSGAEVPDLPGLVRADLHKSSRVFIVLSYGEEMK